MIYCHGCGFATESMVEMFGHICDPEDIPEPSDEPPYITVWSVKERDDG